MYHAKAATISSVIGIFVATTALVTQDPWFRQVQYLLALETEAMNLSGYELTHEVYTGMLNEGYYGTVDAELDEGVEYYVIGVCDVDCRDLDLELYDDDGELMDLDHEPDDVPVVSLTPQRSGVYRLRPIMAQCSEGPCRFGLGIYGG